MIKLAWFILKNPKIISVILQEIKDVFDNNPRTVGEMSKIINQISKGSGYGKVVEYLMCLMIECNIRK